MDNYKILANRPGRIRESSQCGAFSPRPASGFTQTQGHVVELQGEVQSVVKAHDFAMQDYPAGSITLTDVLNADIQLLTAQDELDANRADAARAAVGVYRALGGGWSPANGA